MSNGNGCRTKFLKKETSSKIWRWDKSVIHTFCYFVQTTFQESDRGQKNDKYKKGGKFKFFSPDQTLLDLRIFICSTTYRNGPWVCANNTLGHDRTNSILNIRKKQGENATIKFIKKYIQKKNKNS